MNWFPETHRRISLGELRRTKILYYLGGCMSMFGVLWLIGWLAGI